MTKRGVIFDLDGTLIDSLDDIVCAMNAALADGGLPTHPDAAYPAFIGRGVDFLVLSALPPAHQNELAKFRRAFRDHYKTDASATSVPYDGILALTDQLGDAGIPMSVLSNKKQAPCDALIERFFGTGTFDEVCGERPGVAMKPDPSEAIRLAASMNVAPTDCVFVGDTEIDVQTATAAGMIAVGVAWGFREADALRQAGARQVVDHPLALADAIMG